METIKNLNEVNDLKQNKVYGNFELNNSKIQFLGKNNILFCEENIKLNNCNVFFRGDNSIVYLSFTNFSNYNITINIRSDSTLYIGRDNAMGYNLQITVEEHQNLIIGDDCLIENNIDIRTSESFPIYDANTKHRVNYSQSILIGDHVWLDHFAHISGGVKIGSGSIIGNSSFVPPNSIIKSNTKVLGNPVRIVRDNVFFTKEFTGSFKSEDTLNFSTYKSDVFQFSCVENESLSFNKIDDILKELVVSDRLSFIQKLLVRNKRRNRFSIQ